ncbi:hypothetical protein ATANTOWER_010638 [Ataeniobius toweri]|uniref:Secreted protein n=1 Tax=Ataeniobius toweri TaxID=208326 RepID=A0ABU7B6E4_9TELE|nr:hypothetical protein [Ataeniobius toweri]
MCSIFLSREFYYWLRAYVFSSFYLLDETTKGATAAINTIFTIESTPGPVFQCFFCVFSVFSNPLVGRGRWPPTLSLVLLKVFPIKGEFSFPFFLHACSGGGIAA